MKSNSIKIKNICVHNRIDYSYIHIYYYYKKQEHVCIFDYAGFTNISLVVQIKSILAAKNFMEKYLILKNKLSIEPAPFNQTRTNELLKQFESHFPDENKLLLNILQN